MYSFEEILAEDKEIATAISEEIQRQDSHIELIASENFVSKAVMAACKEALRMYICKCSASFGKPG